MTDSENKEKWISIPYLPPPLEAFRPEDLRLIIASITHWKSIGKV